jgi:hypothetical protein
MVKANSYKDASGTDNAVFYGTPVTPGGLMFRNRIINGSMEIDQRNAGAAVVNSGQFSVDRWADNYSGSGRYSAQRSTVAPSGFVNSLLHTVSTAVTPAATDVYQIFQPVEGSNAVDLAWGTSAAKTITISFWVRSSITGTYGLFIYNSDGTRSITQTYTISAANTWEYKTITLPGDTTGTYYTDNRIGFVLGFDLGSGSNQNTATLGAWQSGAYRRTSGCVNWISTNGATFYLTGVQLEVGSVATPFERRSYGLELNLCQRYYTKMDSTYYGDFGNASNYSVVSIFLPTTMRAIPSASVSGTSGSFAGQLALTNYHWALFYTVAGSGAAASVTTPVFAAEL